MASADLAAAYAALILADDNVEITPEKLQTVTDAANVDIEPIWATLLAKALAGRNVIELLTNIGASAGAPMAAAPAGGAAPAAAAVAEEKEEKKEEEKEESDDDMGFGLFD